MKVLAKGGIKELYIDNIFVELEAAQRKIYT
jgi:hypothetical protein